MGEALVSSNGVHFEVGCLRPEGGLLGGNDRVCLVVVEVEGLLAGARDVGEAAAVPHSEAHLGVDAVSSTPVDERGEEPVVLVGLEDIAHLVRSDGVEVFVVATDFFPLQKGEGKSDEREAEGPAAACEPRRCHSPCTGQGRAGRRIPKPQRGLGTWSWTHGMMRVQKHQPGSTRRNCHPLASACLSPLLPGEAKTSFPCGQQT